MSQYIPIHLFAVYKYYHNKNAIPPEPLILRMFKFLPLLQPFSCCNVIAYAAHYALKL